MISPSTSPPDATQQDPAPTTVPASTETTGTAPYGWLFLGGLALIIALIDPIVLDLQPRLEVSLGLLVLGGGLIAFGVLRRRLPALWAGALVLWIEIAAGIATQLSPLALPQGQIWGPRGLLIAVAFFGWALFLNLPPYLRRALLALALPTFAVLGVLWWSAVPNGVPLPPRRAAIYWLAVDSRGTLYANDVDNGVIWVFDSTGAAQGNLWP